jgi:hypothetical protein
MHFGGGGFWYNFPPTCRCGYRRRGRKHTIRQICKVEQNNAMYVELPGTFAAI